MTYNSKHISVHINSSHHEVYEFTSNPENMVKWAAGLSGSMKKEDDHWISMSPMGKVEVTFAQKNPFGIMDHHVTLESGQSFYNPLRVIQNNQGTEVIFTLFQSPGMSEEDFLRDAEMVKKDLHTLKNILEKK